MGCSSNAVDQGPDPLRQPRKSADSKPDLDTLATEFQVFGDEIRDELDPSGPLERLLADYVIQTAWRLKGSMERQAKRPTADLSEEKKAGSRANPRPTAIEYAARSVREAFEAFQAVRSLIHPRTASAFLVEFPDQPIVAPAEEATESHVEDADASPHWRDRLMFDFEISDRSPVVKGTWVTVSHVVSLIVDGWTWADILRSHPELTEDDIRACVTYAMDEENGRR
jgi:uncharacterized protein (DUF433 family)